MQMHTHIPGTCITVARASPSQPAVDADAGVGRVVPTQLHIQYFLHFKIQLPCASRQNRSPSTRPNPPYCPDGACAAQTACRRYPPCALPSIALTRLVLSLCPLRSPTSTPPAHASSMPSADYRLANERTATVMSAASGMFSSETRPFAHPQRAPVMRRPGPFV